MDNLEIREFNHKSLFERNLRERANEVFSVLRFERGVSAGKSAKNVLEQVLARLTRALKNHAGTCTSCKKLADRVWFDTSVSMWVDFRCYLRVLSVALPEDEAAGTSFAQRFWEAECLDRIAVTRGADLWSKKHLALVCGLANKFLTASEHELLHADSRAEVAKLADCRGWTLQSRIRNRRGSEHLTISPFTTDTVDQLWQYSKVLRSLASSLCAAIDAVERRSAKFHPRQAPTMTNDHTRPSIQFREALLDRFTITRIAGSPYRFNLQVILPRKVIHLWNSLQHRSFLRTLTKRTLATRADTQSVVRQSFFARELDSRTTSLVLKDGTIELRTQLNYGPFGKGPHSGRYIGQLADRKHPGQMRWLVAGALLIVRPRRFTLLWAAYREGREKGFDVPFISSQSRIDQCLPDSLITSVVREHILAVHEAKDGPLRYINFEFDMSNSTFDPARRLAVLSRLYPGRGLWEHETVRLRTIPGPVSLTVTEQPIFGSANQDRWIKHRTNDLFVSLDMQSQVLRVFRVFFWPQFSPSANRAIRDGTSPSGQPTFWLPLEELYSQFVNCGEVPEDLGPWMRWSDMIHVSELDPWESWRDRALCNKYPLRILPGLRDALQQFFECHDIRRSSTLGGH